MALELKYPTEPPYIPSGGIMVGDYRHITRDSVELHPGLLELTSIPLTRDSKGIEFVLPKSCP